MSFESIAITGASGYLGSKLDFFLGRNGFHVIRLTRSPNGDSSRQFNLNTVNDRNLLANVKILIHCAHDFSNSSYKEAYNKNYHGTEELFKLAKRGSVEKIIYISSIGAINNSNSSYGKLKFQLENLARDYNAIIIRPAFIISKEPGGIYKKIVTLLSTRKFIPYFINYIPFYVTYEEELLEFIYSLIISSNKNSSSKIYSAFNKNPVDFTFFLKKTSNDLALSNIFIPFPEKFIFYFLRSMEYLKFNLKFSSDSFCGLICGKKISNFQDSDAEFDFSEFK